MVIILFFGGIAAICYYLSWYFKNAAKQVKKQTEKAQAIPHNQKADTASQIQPESHQKQEESSQTVEIVSTPQKSSSPAKVAEDYIKELEEAKQKREAEGTRYDVVFIDIEATSYKTAERNEILQVAIIDKSKNVLINQYCKPRKQSWEKASAINSIYPYTVSDCPNFKDVKPYVEDILNRADKIVTFDFYLVRDYLDKYKIEKSSSISSPVNEYRRYNQILGIENPKWTTLEDVAEEIGLFYDFNDALEDAKAISDVCRYLDEQKNEVKDEIAKNKVNNKTKAKYVQNINADKSNYFYNKKIAFADSLSISREDAFEKVSEKGAIIRLTVTPTLDILVCGTRSTLMKSSYGEISSEQRKAEKLNASGANIEIMSGEKFMALLEQPAGDA